MRLLPLLLLLTHLLPAQPLVEVSAGSGSYGRLEALGPGLWPAAAATVGSHWGREVRPWVQLRAGVELGYEGLRRPGFYGHIGSLRLPVGVVLRPGFGRSWAWQPGIWLAASPSVQLWAQRAGFPDWGRQLQRLRWSGQVGLGLTGPAGRRGRPEAWLRARLTSPLDTGPARAPLYGLDLSLGLGWWLPGRPQPAAEGR